MGNSMYLNETIEALVVRKKMKSTIHRLRPGGSLQTVGIF